LERASVPPDTEEEYQEKPADWDPVDLLVPEWRYLQKPSLFPQQQDTSGLMVTSPGQTHPGRVRRIHYDQQARHSIRAGVNRAAEARRHQHAGRSRQFPASKYD
jgi:hypothetical protein